MYGGIRPRRPLLVGGRGRAWRRGRTGFSGPDQATAVVRDDVWVGVQQFVLEVLKGVIIQGELPFERPIGHAASPLEHRNHVIENLLEGHGRLSIALALVPSESNVRPGGVSLGNAPRVYQESGGGAGEIAPPCRAPGRGALGR